MYALALPSEENSTRMSYMIFGTVSVLMNINFEISLKLVVEMRLAIKSVLYRSMN